MNEMTRRNWLKTATVAGAALGLGAELRPEENERPSRKPEEKPGWKTALGLNGFASARKYGKKFALREVLAFAKKTGFRGIELVENWPDGPYPSSRDRKRVLEIRSLYEGFSLKPFSIQTGSARAFDPSPAVRQGWIDQMRDRVALSKALGGECVGTWPFGQIRGQKIGQAIKNLAESYREVARIAHSEGIVFAFEIEPPFVFRTEKHLVRILEEANEPKLKTIYDPSHFDLMSEPPEKSTGKPHEMLKRIGVEHIGYVHFTDTDGTLRDGGTSRHLPAGDGHVDLNASFRTLWDGGFRGWVMIDGWEIPDPFDAGRKGIEAIEKFLASKK